MSVATATVIMTVLGGYLLIGLLVGLMMLFGGLGKIDPAAGSMSWRVRLLLLPGLVGLWPVMLIKRMRQTAPPLQ